MKHLLISAVSSALLSTAFVLLPISGWAQVEQEPMQEQPPVGDPNYYGPVDPADTTAPPVVYSTPVVVQPAPAGVVYPPVYLRVPPVYYQNWPQYCGYYNACFYPVFFVQEGWYLNWYGPWYRRYYPYGRPGFSGHFYYGPHGDYYHRGGGWGHFHGGYHR